MIATWLMTNTAPMSIPSTAMIPAQGGDSLWLPEQASTFASTVDSAWALVYWISVFFFVLVVVIQAIFIWKYRRRPGWTEQKTAHHNYPLELTWSIIPSLLIVLMFIKGFMGFLDMRTPPANTYDINVTAAKWSWQFEYPEGYTDPELHVPMNTNVKLIMASNDVIHSLFIDAFRVKQDVVPGRYNYLWFNATKPGDYHLQCAEYCGRNHSDMRTMVHVYEDEQGMADFFARKERELFETPPLELGEKLYKDLACVQCHALDSSTKVGPGFAQTYGVDHPLEGGGSAYGDENYIRQSIENPMLHVRAGFRPTMPTFKGLKEPEIHALVGFIKAQNPDFKAQAEQQYAKPLPPPDEAAGDAAAAPDGTPAGEGDEGGEPANVRE